MDSKYTIKNFRVFDEEGATIQLRPMTILTGCNSSGKSSIVKSLLMLNNYLCKIKEDVDNDREIDLNKYKIDFSEKPLNLLGRFDKVVNNKSQKGTITMEYTTYSKMLSENIYVKMEFRLNRFDTLNNGYLSRIVIKNNGGNIIYSIGKEGENIRNLNLIRDAFVRFVNFQHIWYNCESELEDYMLTHSTFCNKNSIKKIDPYIKKYGARITDDIIDISTGIEHSLLEENTSNHPEIIQKTLEFGTFYYLPIFEELKGLSKKATIFYFEEKFNSKDDFVLNRVLKDYNNSKHTSFLAYYIDKEKEFFYSNEEVKSDEYTGIKIEKNLNPSQNYRLTNPEKLYVINNFFENIDGKEEDYLEKADVTKEEIEEWKNRYIDFNIVYEALINICGNMDNSETYFYEMVGYYYHRIPIVFSAYIKKLFEEILVPNFSGSLSYTSSSRASVKRLYILEDKDNFSEILLRYFSAKKNTYDNLYKLYYDDKAKKYKPDTFLNKWIKKFEIGESILFETDKEGPVVLIRLKKDKSGDESLLADEGYGMTQLISILLQIEVGILEAKIVFKAKSRDNLGYEIFLSKKDLNFFITPTTIAIEEPEIHLHPKFQSMLAEMFVDAYKTYNIQFIIETHSEYLIRKLQTLVAKKDITTDEVSLNYMYDPDPAKRPANMPQIKKIEIGNDGRLKSAFGSGFFDEADNLTMDLLTLKAYQND